MNVEKCKTCKNFEKFFYGCNLYYREVYLEEGNFDIQTISIKEITEKQCKYEKIGD